jgi:hypothetical protein
MRLSDSEEDRSEDPESFTWNCCDEDGRDNGCETGDLNHNVGRSQRDERFVAFAFQCWQQCFRDRPSVVVRARILSRGEGRAAQADPRGTGPIELQAVVFYTDTEHKVDKVTKGARIVLEEDCTVPSSAS